jgi:hypothetical protein
MQRKRSIQTFYEIIICGQTAKRQSGRKIRKDERRDNDNHDLRVDALTANATFRSYPALTDPGGLLRAVSGKTEKMTHDQTLQKNMGEVKFDKNLFGPQYGFGARFQTM